jgi:hypothetical protein
MLDGRHPDSYKAPANWASPSARFLKRFVEVDARQLRTATRGPATPADPDEMPFDAWPRSSFRRGDFRHPSRHVGRQTYRGGFGG